MCDFVEKLKVGFVLLEGFRHGKPSVHIGRLCPRVFFKPILQPATLQQLSLPATGKGDMGWSLRNGQSHKVL